jgi:hypothetical protein
MSTIVGAKQVLETAKEYLSKIEADKYSHKEELLSGSSIGEHTRHFIEFFQCLLEQNRAGICINYSKRLRNHDLETNPNYALEIINQIQDELSTLDNRGPVNVQCSIEPQLEEGNNQAIITTLERELLYNIEHTIHHLAIIKIGLKLVAPDIPISDHFGVAASTIEFRKNNQEKSTSLVGLN